MRLSRRGLIGGVGAALVAPSVALAAGGGRVFQVLRGGQPFGAQRLDVSLGPDGAAEVSIEIELAVKLLGVTAYRYTMRNRETWRGGRLVSMDSVVDDDGEPHHVRARAAGEVIEIDGSGFQGTAPGDAASTTYWSTEFLNRKVWINTQTGVPIEVTTARIGPGRVTGAGGSIATERWTAKGGNLDVVLHYAGEEWVSVEFDAGGEPAIYLPENLSPELGPVWTASL